MNARLLVAFICAVVSGTAYAQSTSFLWAPYSGVPSEARSHLWQSADVFHCYAWRPPVGITNATKIGYRTGTTTASGTTGIAIYSADRATQLVEGMAAYSAANTNVTMTGLPPFSLTAETHYWLCWCSSTGGAGYTGSDMLSSYVDAMENAFETRAGISATPCSGGDPPPTLGAITPGLVNPPFVVLGTDTP